MSKPKHYEAWQALLELIESTSDTAKLDDLLSFFLSHDEREALATRYALIQALLKGELTQREIAANLEISIAKITRGSNALKAITPELKSYLEHELK